MVTKVISLSPLLSGCRVVVLIITSGISVTAAVTFSSNIDLCGSGPDRMRQQKGWRGGFRLGVALAETLPAGLEEVEVLPPVLVESAALKTGAVVPGVEVSVVLRSVVGELATGSAEVLNLESGPV